MFRMLDEMNQYLNL